MWEQLVMGMEWCIRDECMLGRLHCIVAHTAHIENIMFEDEFEEPERGDYVVLCTGNQSICAPVQSVHYQ